MNRFQMPAVGDEFAGQPVEQFRMRGVAPHRPEIVRRGHDPLAEVILPNTVNHHSRGEWMIGASEPFGQRRSSAGGFRLGGGRSEFRFTGAKKRGKAGSYFLLRFLIIADGQHAGWRQLAVAVGNGHCRG